MTTDNHAGIQRPKPTWHERSARELVLARARHHAAEQLAAARLGPWDDLTAIFQRQYDQLCALEAGHETHADRLQRMTEDTDDAL